ncbi:cysteine-rich receptor-like protein kinase 3 isoform X2 [Daucus carota subsp. sativus]|uniref:cysteine-rich receptor-like protein kinase 3 isoform X2 n=1 Tax=Daucus carota subsp. sativus TaxID=79200 RepID=UPI0030834C85
MLTVIQLPGAFLILLTIMLGVLSDPQIVLLRQDCTRQTRIRVEMSVFMSNYNRTFDEIRRQLSNNQNLHFATTVETDVYGMVQCRNYLSSADCIACLDFARVQVRRNCPDNDGGHVIYKGCFLRYESYNFYTQSLLVSFEASAGICNTNQSKLQAAAFKPVVEGIMTDLVAATPKINGYFAATTRPVSSGGVTSKVYAAAQCVETISQKDCQSCLTIAYNNLQNCPPGSEGSSADAGCFLRYSDASFFADNIIINITPYLRGGTSSSKTTIIGAVVGVLCILLILATLLWYQFVRKANVAQRGDMLGLSKLQGPVTYSFKDLKSATRSFSEDSKIGEGGYGDVYKGILKNGDVVAVKKLSVGTSKAKEDFESEVKLIININHRNIIRLLGWSRRGSELLLVFEYMANGSLDTFLYDFGLARLIRDDQSHVSTRFAGTLGYTAPEYAIHGHLSEKVDTYAFGVVVLEIVSGRRCTNLNIKSDNGSLLEHTWNLYSDDMHSDLVDENLDPNEYNTDQVKKIIEIALLCTQSPTSMRPTMSEVVVLLTNDSSIKQKPGKPTLF